MEFDSCQQEVNGIQYDHRGSAMRSWHVIYIYIYLSSVYWRKPGICANEPCKVNLITAIHRHTTLNCCIAEIVSLEANGPICVLKTVTS